jgi:hypothetical protein
LDRERDAKTDHSGHTPVVPGHPEQSELYRRITNSDIDERMPPAKSGKTLSAEEIDLLRRWIAELDSNDFDTRQAAEDIVQQVFMVVHRRLPDLQSSESAKPRTSRAM